LDGWVLETTRLAWLGYRRIITEIIAKNRRKVERRKERQRPPADAQEVC
jgi:hypothetical protein